MCIEVLVLSIQASLEAKIEKRDTIGKIRIYVEALKHLIRTESELNIIKEVEYLSLEEKLQEISKEASGWEKFITNNSPQGKLM